MTDLDRAAIMRRQRNAKALLAGNADEGGEFPEQDLHQLVDEDVNALLCELERLTDQDVVDMLGSIDNALRNGSNMNNANLAFELLCERLGVDREALVFAPDRIGQIEDPAWRPRPPGWVERPAPVGSWWQTEDGVACVDGDYLDGPGDQVVTYVLHRPDGTSGYGKWGGQEFADAYTRLDGPPAWIASTEQDVPTEGGDHGDR